MIQKARMVCGSSMLDSIMFVATALCYQVGIGIKGCPKLLSRCFLYPTWTYNVIHIATLSWPLALGSCLGPFVLTMSVHIHQFLEQSKCGHSAVWLELPCCCHIGEALLPTMSLGSLPWGLLNCELKDVCKCSREHVMTSDLRPVGKSVGSWYDCLQSQPQLHCRILTGERFPGHLQHAWSMWQLCFISFLA